MPPSAAATSTTSHRFEQRSLQRPRLSWGRWTLGRKEALERHYPETKNAPVPQRALPHQGKPSLAGQARFSSLVAAPSHGGLISIFVGCIQAAKRELACLSTGYCDRGYLLSTVRVRLMWHGPLPLAVPPGAPTPFGAQGPGRPRLRPLARRRRAVLTLEYEDLGLQTLFRQFSTICRRLRPGRHRRSSSPSTAAIRPCCCRCCCRP